MSEPLEGPWPSHDPYEVTPPQDTDDCGEECWQVTDLGDLVALAVNGHLPPLAASVGILPDTGRGLFYPGKINGIAGESGSGKSFIALAVALQEAGQDHHVIYIDYEDSAATMARRLALMGATPEQSRRIHHVTARGPWPRQRRRIVAIASECMATLIVVDSTGEAMAADGADTNGETDVSRWFQSFPVALADLEPCVLLVDHMPKAAGDDLYPIGSHRKRAGISGAQYIARAVRSFSKDRPGETVLIVGKDREGNGYKGERVAKITFNPNVGDLTVGLWSILPEPLAADGGHRPTHLMERVSRYVESNPGHGVNQVAQDVEGNRASIRRAIRVLLDENHLAKVTGPNRKHSLSSVLPYRVAADQTGAAT